MLNVFQQASKHWLSRALLEYTLLANSRIMCVNNGFVCLVSFFTFYLLFRLHILLLRLFTSFPFLVSAFWLISVCQPKKWACIVCCVQTFVGGSSSFLSSLWPKMMATKKAVIKRRVSAWVINNRNALKTKPIFIVIHMQMPRFFSFFLSSNQLDETTNCRSPAIGQLSRPRNWNLNEHNILALIQGKFW